MFKKLAESKIINKLIFVFVGIFVLFTILMKASTDVLNNSVYNIVNFEFLWTYDKYQLVLDSWSNTVIKAAITNTWLDFGWLIGYGGLIFTLNLKLSNKIQNNFKKLVMFASVAGVIAVVFDIFENIILLNLLYQTDVVFNSLPLIVSIIASIKFAFVFIGIIIFLIGLLVVAINHFKAKKYIN